MKTVITCEHATNHIPEAYKYLFAENKKVLYTHEGYDPGAFDTFEFLKHLADYSKYQTIGRLLVETNRSIGHKSLFSRFSADLNIKEKKEVLDAYYFQYRDAIENQISEYINAGEKVLHLSIHSFTPQLNGIIRECDIGILYDPGRSLEKEFSKKLKRSLIKELPGLRLRYNYPYLGKADGFTTYLRNKFKSNYAGIEIEINQKWAEDEVMPLGIKESFYKAIQSIKQKKP
ncbi:N-formylglutamate amidohydrolase [Christiangramia aquimixticola]|uniref:N-formylglutamate amidohydrolase n=1 Tax=Christiangramia aquimixticola TaxID=1697558 RepID=UPI003AA98A57